MKFLKNVKTDEFMATVTRTASKYGYKLKLSLIHISEPTRP